MESTIRKKNVINDKKHTPAPKINAAVYQFLCAAASVWRFFINGHTAATESFLKQQKSGASLIVSNHLSAFDFIYSTPPLRGRKTNFVVAENMTIAKPIFAKLLKFYGAIVKKQNFADFQCIKSIKRYLDAGISVVICPEGKVASDGKTGIITSTTARFIKWLGYPVLGVVIKGSGLMRPKWAYKNRKVRVEVHCDVMLTKDEVKTLSQQEIHETVIRTLSHNDHAYQAENRIAVRGKNLAEGLERQLYLCPNCGAEFMNRSKGGLLYCTACGNTVRYLPTGELMPVDNKENPAASVSFGRVDIWSDAQRKRVREEIQHVDFKLSNAVDLFIETADKSGYKFIAHGTVTLTADELRFNTTEETRLKNVNAKYGVTTMEILPEGSETEQVENEFKEISFNVKTLSTVANLPGDTLDLYDERHMYRIIFTKERASTKYVMAIEALSFGKN